MRLADERKGGRNGETSYSSPCNPPFPRPHDARARPTTPGTAIDPYRGGDAGFFSVSPFAVTGFSDVGDVLVAFGPSVELPLELVIPDCVWFCVLVDPVDEAPIPDESLLMLEPPLIFELSLMLEPLLIPPLLSVAAGATAPPAVVVSVALVLSPLAHAASRAMVATIAMRFIEILRSK